MWGLVLVFLREALSERETLYFVILGTGLRINLSLIFHSTLLKLMGKHWRDSVRTRLRWLWVLAFFFYFFVSDLEQVNISRILVSSYIKQWHFRSTQLFESKHAWIEAGSPWASLPNNSKLLLSLVRRVTLSKWLLSTVSFLPGKWLVAA